VFRLAIFVLAIFVGYYVVWSGDAGAAHAADVGHQRHLLGHRRRRAAGGRRQAAAALGDGPIWAKALRLHRLVLASVNIFGGFLVTQRMLAMYKKKG
jgi:NAD(P) transhydrogenase subunit alpha